MSSSRQRVVVCGLQRSCPRRCGWHRVAQVHQCAGAAAFGAGNDCITVCTSQQAASQPGSAGTGMRGRWSEAFCPDASTFTKSHHLRLMHASPRIQFLRMKESHAARAFAARPAGGRHSRVASAECRHHPSAITACHCTHGQPLTSPQPSLQTDLTAHKHPADRRTRQTGRGLSVQHPPQRR